MASEDPAKWLGWRGARGFRQEPQGSKTLGPCQCNSVRRFEVPALVEITRVQFSTVDDFKGLERLETYFSHAEQATWPPPRHATQPQTGCKSYNFPTSHHATRKTQTPTPTASNTESTAPIITPRHSPTRAIVVAITKIDL